ncbi:MAG TPA: hypothetical protein VG055_26225 [Planctomycetaceae bacterium]|nr:hypothetical protein [Planctomycetaceae bacterium]
MSAEPNKPYMSRWQRVASYAFITVFSTWCWSDAVGLIGPAAPYMGAVVGMGISYLIHRATQARRTGLSR